MPKQAISANGLTKQYGSELAVSDLSLSISEGSVYGFLGPNGAGKTTTMRLLTALTAPTSGHAEVNGVSITDRASLTENIGYLPANPPVFDELTGREQLRYLARLQELPMDRATSRIDEQLQTFELESDADRRISEYSTGMRKKIGLIGTILHDPAVVFLDEPTSGLDPHAARTMRETIATLADRDITVFLSSHILPVVDELADIIGVIDDGELIAEGTPAELKQRADGDHPDLETAFLNITTNSDEREAEPTGGHGE